MADETLAISEVRTNLTELVAQVRIARRRVMLTQRGKPGAVLCPPELDAAIDAAGGLDAAIEVLQRAAARPPGQAPAGGGTR